MTAPYASQPDIIKQFLILFCGAGPTSLALRRCCPVGGALTYAWAYPGTNPPTSPRSWHHNPSQTFYVSVSSTPSVLVSSSQLMLYKYFTPLKRAPSVPTPKNQRKSSAKTPTILGQWPSQQKRNARRPLQHSLQPSSYKWPTSQHLIPDMFKMTPGVIH
jgi:hypothetical protein